MWDEANGQVGGVEHVVLSSLCLPCSLSEVSLLVVLCCALLTMLDTGGVIHRGGGMGMGATLLGRLGSWAGWAWVGIAVQACWLPTPTN